MTVLFILFVVLMAGVIRWYIHLADRAENAGRNCARKRAGLPPIPSSAQLRREWEDHNG